MSDFGAVRALGARSSAALAAACMLGLVAAAVDAGFARSAAAEPPGFFTTALANAGLIVPVALAVGLFVGTFSYVLHPRAAPAFGRIRQVLDAAGNERRAYIAALIPLSALGTLLWLIMVARIALAFLAADLSASVVAAGLALSASLAAVMLSLLVLGAAHSLARLWHAGPPDPLLSGALGVGFAGLVLGFAIGTGETSGSGGALAVFGVLKRPELDLRAPGLLFSIAIGAYLLPAALDRVPWYLLLGVAVLPLLLSYHSAQSALDERRVALTLERGAPLGKLMLATFRRLLDRDKDGFSARFGGGDCNDADPRINPGSEDVPGNRLDEDCSGKDEPRISLGKSQGATAVETRRPKLPEKLGVIFITVDTLRYDLGFAGNPRPVSPNLDALAKRSVVFENAYSLASYTSKSLPPLLIGKYPSETHRGWSHFNRFTKDDKFVQERLQRAGVRTVSVQGYWYFFNQGVGFERGFDVLDSSAAPKVVQMEGDRTTNSGKISDAAIEQLKKPENTRDRFFFWIHYIDPHTEYVKHDEFDFGSGSRERYDSEVAFVDKHVGRILDFVHKSDLGRRTAIIVTSDHGEAFGEHGMIRHGFEVWEELVRVPLLVYVPGVPPRRIAKRRGAIDVVPTLLDLFEQPVPRGDGTDFVSGESLLAELFLPPGQEPNDKIVFVDMSAGPNNADRQAFVEHDLKLIASDGRPLGLYDLAKDPGEKHDLLDDAALKQKVLARFKAFRRELKVVPVKPVAK